MAPATGAEWDPINSAAFDIITRNEGCMLHAYQDTRGIWTIGFGHTGKDVFRGRVITGEVADALLHSDLSTAEMAVDDALADGVDTSENEYGAMVSLTFNIGPGAFAKSSIIRHHNEGNKQAAADAFLLYNLSAGRVLAGLVRRRHEERALYLTPDK